MKSVFKRLTAYDILIMIISLMFVVAQVWLELKLPDYMKKVTMIIYSPDGTVSQVLREGGMMLLCTAASALTAVVVGFFAARVAAGFSYRLRGDVFERVESFSLEELNSFSTDSLITRTTNDITQIQMLVAMGMQMIIRAPVMAAMAIGKIAVSNWQWTALTGGLVLALVILIASVMSYAIPRFRRIQKLTDNLNRVTRENLTGIRVVRAYNAEVFEEARFEGANLEYTANNLQAHRAMQLMNPVMRMVMSGISLGIFWIGAYLIDAAAGMEKVVILSDMVVFSQYAMQIIMSFMMLTMVFIMAPRVMVSVRRVSEVLGTEPKIKDGAVTETTNGLIGVVEFRDVSFRYPDAEEYVLQNISFKVERGETVAFIGSTGSGKSTLINLVPRFYDATEGEVLVDGVNVRDYTQEALRNKLGYIPQRAVLFSGTVSTNVSFGSNGRDVPDNEEIRRAVRIAQGAEFVENMENSYDASIAQGGTNISGGQKQRLAIARAVCRAPEILIFDDSFSALDYRTDRTLRSALKSETAGVTNLIVAQRIGTIREADRIIVLDEGKIVGTGTHDELMASCAVYQEIAYSQLSKEELGA